MRKIGKWLVPFALVVIVLSVPMVVGAALSPPSLTGYGGANWLSSIDDSGDVVAKGYDILHAYQAYQSSNYYFQVEMDKLNPSFSATSYVLHIDSRSFAANLSWVGGTEIWSTPSLASGEAFVQGGQGGKSLEWKLTAADLSTVGPNSTWWIETFNGSTLMDSTIHAAVVTPIPGAAWLLGSGLIGLIGLKRRKRKTA